MIKFDIVFSIAIYQVAQANMKKTLSGISRVIAFLVIGWASLVAPVFAQSTFFSPDYSPDVASLDFSEVASPIWANLPGELPNHGLGEVDLAECEETQEEQRHIGADKSVLLWSSDPRDSFGYLCTKPGTGLFFPALRKRYLVFHCLRINC